MVSRPFYKHLLRVDILTPCLVLPKEAGLRISILTIYHSEKTCRTLNGPHFFQLLLIEIIAKLTDRCSDFSVEVEPSLSKAEAYLGYIAVQTLQ